MKVVSASKPVEQPEYFRDAEEYLFTTRSRWARYFKEGGIVPQEADYSPVDHSMRNELEGHLIRVDDDEIRAALFIRDNYIFFGLEGENSFELGWETKLADWGHTTGRILASTQVSSQETSQVREEKQER